MPVPIVITTASLAPRAAPARCSASAATLPSLSTNTGRSEPLGHHVGERDVGQRQVDRDDRDPGALVDQAGDPEADRLDLGPGGLAHLWTASTATSSSAA